MTGRLYRRKWLWDASGCECTTAGWIHRGLRRRCGARDAAVNAPVSRTAWSPSAAVFRASQERDHLFAWAFPRMRAHAMLHGAHAFIASNRRTCVHFHHCGLVQRGGFRKRPCRQAAPPQRQHRVPQEAGRLRDCSSARAADHVSNDPARGGSIPVGHGGRDGRCSVMQPVTSGHTVIDMLGSPAAGAATAPASAAGGGEWTMHRGGVARLKYLTSLSA